MPLTKQFDEATWNPKIREMEISWFSRAGFPLPPDPELFPAMH